MKIKKELNIYFMQFEILGIALNYESLKRLTRSISSEYFLKLSQCDKREQNKNHEIFVTIL